MVLDQGDLGSRGYVTMSGDVLIIEPEEEVSSV